MHVGARIVGSLCEECLKPGGCLPGNRHFAGKVTRLTNPLKIIPSFQVADVEITHCADRPELVGEMVTVTTKSITIID